MLVWISLICDGVQLMHTAQVYEMRQESGLKFCLWLECKGLGLDSKDTSSKLQWEQLWRDARPQETKTLLCQRVGSTTTDNLVFLLPENHESLLSAWPVENLCLISIFIQGKSTFCTTQAIDFCLYRLEISGSKKEDEYGCWLAINIREKTRNAMMHESRRYRCCNFMYLQG